MAKRYSSAKSSAEQVNRQINDSAYDNVKIVADGIEHVNVVATAINDGTFASIDEIVNQPLKGSILALGPIAQEIATTASISDKVVAVANNEVDVSIVADDIVSINTVAQNIIDVKTVATNITNVNKVAAIDTKVSAVADNEANVNTVADAIDNVNFVGNTIDNVDNVATNMEAILDVSSEPLRQSILDAESNATTAQLQAWEAEARKMTADSYATEPEDTFVKVYTSNGDGTFTATDTTEYSSLHYMEKAEYVVTGDGVVLTYGEQTLDSKTLTNTASIDFGDGTGPGHVSWNTDDMTLDVVLNNEVTQQVGQELLVKVKNASGSLIPNGTVLMVTGTSGNSGNIEVGPHDGTQANGYKVAGIATQNIANGAEGFSLLRGKLRGIDTTGTPYGETWNEGDSLWIRPNDTGALTNVEPIDSELHMFVGIVVNVHANNGTIQVRVNGVDENGVKPWVLSKVAEHTDRKDNPHEVTKAQVGLGNVDNTSDVDKPVSTAQQTELDLKLDKVGGTVTGNLTISGNLAVNGTSTAVNTEEVLAKDNLIVINSGEVGNGVTAGSAGIEVDRGDATNYEFKYVEASEDFRIGEVGNLQPVATREDAPLNTGIAVWNSATNKFETTRDIDIDSITVNGTVDGRDVSTDGAKLDGIEEGATADQTASEILTAVKTVDGSGSGLDSDLLDGQHGSYYQNASNLNTGTINDERLPNTITSDTTGNASTATKLATPRTITLGGDLSGSTTFDGSGNVTLSAQVADNSHNHTSLYGTIRFHDSTGNGYNNSNILVDGNGITNTIKPSIGFHQPMLYAGTLSMENANTFQFKDQNGNPAILDNSITGLGTAATTASTDYAKSQGRVVNDGNLIRDSGMYGINGSAANVPATYGSLIVARNSDTGLQIAGGHLNNNLCFRGWHSFGAVFTPWRFVHHTGNIQQVTGASTEYPMSQKAVTDAINGVSDRRDKADIQSIHTGLDLIEKLNPVSFKINHRQWYRTQDATSIVEVEGEDGVISKDTAIDEEILNKPLSDYDDNDESLKKNSLYTGFIAQDLKQTLDEMGLSDWGMVKNYSEEYGGDDRYYIEHTGLIPVLVKAVQELSVRVKELESKVGSE